MTNDDAILRQLSAQQTAAGAFVSYCHWGEQTYCDANGFVTALVLRATRHWPTSPTLDQMRTRALDFLQQCEATTSPGAFGFWPRAGVPEWIHEPPPPDADDTAIYAIELARYGRLQQMDLQRIVRTVLLPHRLRAIEPLAPGWLRRGVFGTWLWAGHADDVQIVDCCVNANVLALLAAAGWQRFPGVQEVCTMLANALAWAGEDFHRARSLTPFYPHPMELRYAIEHAIECGMDALRPSLQLLQSLPWATATDTTTHPLCSNAYGPVYWTAPALQLARSYRWVEPTAEPHRFPHYNQQGELIYGKTEKEYEFV